MKIHEDNLDVALQLIHLAGLKEGLKFSDLKTKDKLEFLSQSPEDWWDNFKINNKDIMTKIDNLVYKDSE